jgi:hypothetical protein
MFRLLVEESRASGEEENSGHHQVAFAKSTDVFQMVKFIRAMLLIARADLTTSVVLIASESLIVGNVLNLERSSAASEGYFECLVANWVAGKLSPGLIPVQIVARELLPPN